MTAVVTPADPAKYIGGVKIWRVGLKDDPVPGEKRGKGVQHLNSSSFISDLAVHIGANLPTLRQHLEHIRPASVEYRYRYLLNQSNMLFCKAENLGLASTQALNAWLMASWMCMAATEIDTFDFGKYSEEEREQLREKFFSSYLQDPLVAPEGAPPPPASAAPPARIDLIPRVALERVGIHNELCALKYGDRADGWLKDGFQVAARIDSCKRHFDESHALERDEDAIAHLIWNFMACEFFAAALATLLRAFD